ncbi:DNA repair protein RadA [Candidatus Cytomitobacter indipagum]|uniref:DNA repair protein RadA n=1 Tax=Candidatus Cytomitobacter indipagum TaxID=2601575 RepID=A0A5C0UDM4_9PROT|nr:DNA repair protein RadA [Candidatus Cytomitobacter indipagum]QEK38088.1 DNA repair protein RadA [Candidatus Cytomitobacter indipagum]
MSKSKAAKFACKECQAFYAKWTGKCDACGSWNSIIENVVENRSVNQLELQSLTGDSKPVTRFQTEISEFDYVCGGGIVLGSVILIGGDPGIGKSTLLLQISAAFKEKSVVYVSGEESIEQIKVRANRLKLELKNLKCAYGTNLEQILYTLDNTDPGIVMIDSIQTMYDGYSETTPGSVAQVRICGNKLIQWAKNRNIPLIIISHVNKDGMIAGPKVLEHMVDTVLYFEGSDSLRILRSIKNRFGATNSMGIFEMRDKGLIPVDNASKSFLKNRSVIHGSCIFPAVEGSRPLLVEIQSLISNSYLQNPRRAVVGWDVQRLAMICAVLENQCKIIVSGKDIYLNIVGGIRLLEPASDLAVAMSLLSSWYKIAIPNDCIAFGEIGLSGEIRPISHVDQRLKEAEKLGFNSACIPKGSELSHDMKVFKFAHINQVHAWIREQATMNND